MRTSRFAEEQIAMALRQGKVGTPVEVLSERNRAWPAIAPRL